MKHSRLHTSRSSDPELPRNPTSTATTFCQYLVLMYLALNYILEDSPPRVQHSEKARQSQSSTSSTKHDQTPSTKPRPKSEAEPHISTERGGISTAEHPHPQTTTPKQSFFHPHRRRSGSLQECQTYPAETNLRDRNPIISKVQTSEAWSRIRAVSRTPGNPVGMQHGRNKGKKPPKKVRWRVVQTRQFESESEVQDRERAGQRESFTDNARAREDRAKRVLRTTVETEGEHEHWGSTEGSDGQLG